MTDLTPTTELEAVNRILATIGEAKVNTLAGSIPADAQKARDRLTETSRSIQKEGYTFNTDSELDLVPDVDGFVSLPPNVLKVVFVGETDLVVRGRRIYDRVEHTYDIDRTITADVTTFLDYDELPEAARAYVFMVAARSFQDEELGDSTAHQIKEKDVAQARRDFLDWDAEQAQYNFNNNTMMQRFKRRRPASG